MISRTKRIAISIVLGIAAIAYQFLDTSIVAKVCIVLGYLCILWGLNCPPNKNKEGNSSEDKRKRLKLVGILSAIFIIVCMLIVILRLLVF